MMSRTDFVWYVHTEVGQKRILGEAMTIQLHEH
jgi:hypothetical protein